MLQQLQQWQLQATLITFSAAVSACEKSAKWQEAIHLLGEVELQRLEGDLILHNAAIRACEQATKWQQALHLLHQAEENQLRSNEITYSSVIVCSARCGAQHVAVALYGAQTRCTPLALQAVLSSEGLNAAAELLQMQQRTEQMLLEQFGA